MHITELIISNVLKIKALHIRPKGEIITIHGDNGAGKSSLLDSIVMAFRGKREFPVEPLHRGTKKGSIKISLDGDPAVGLPPFTITTTITEKGNTLTIEPDKLLQAGETPRSFLDKLIGKVSFDPIEFINMPGKSEAEKSKQQRKILLDLIGIDVDKLDQDEKIIYDERTVKGREKVTTETKLKSLRQHPGVKETKEISITDLSTKLSKALNHNQAIENRKTVNESLRQHGLNLKATVERLKQELADAEEKLSQTREKFNDEKAAIALLEPIIISDINQEISEIENKNSQIRDNVTYESEKINLNKIVIEYNNIDFQLEAIRQQRIDTISGAAMPVPGLSFDESGLLYNDIPFSQCSQGEQLMIAMNILMELNPTVRVARIKDASLLGTKNMEVLRTIAKEKDFQIWLERVADRDGYEKGGKIGIFITEGEAEGDEVIKYTQPPLSTAPLKDKSKKSTSNKQQPVPTPQPSADDEW